MSRWLPVPAYLGWMIALHLWIAGAGTLFAARVLGLGWIAAAASAVAVMLGGSVPGWIHNGHLLLMYSVSWVPIAFGLAVVSVRSGRLVPDGRLVAVLVLQFLSGYLQGTLYLAAALAFYYLFSVAWPDRAGESNTRPRWIPFAQLASLGVLAAAASALNCDAQSMPGLGSCGSSTASRTPTLSRAASPPTAALSAASDPRFQIQSPKSKI